MATAILTIVIFLPLMGAAWVYGGNPDDGRSLRNKALLVSVLTAAVTLAAVVLFFQQPGADDGRYALEVNVPWISASPGADGAVDIRYHLGIDGISLWLLVLTAFLTPLAIWASFSGIQHRVREYYAWMLVIETGMLGVFCSLDLLLFYVFFESTLIPLYFLVGIWGGPLRRQAATKLFIYTLAGSVLTFAGILYLGYFAYSHPSVGRFTFDIQTLTGMGQAGLIPAGVQWWLFAAFAAGFAIKVPLFPFHTWLPLAHTEAPTAGSVILAGVLLKLGTYGFTRLSIPILPDAAVTFAPFMATLAVIGIIYGALAAWVQDDVKKLVAYSSVSHLGFCMLGLFSLKMAGISGAVLYMVNHGLSTGALFLVVGMIYERYHTRDIHKIGGLAKPMPWMAFFLIVFTLSSIGLPGLNGFVSEFLVLLGTATSNTMRDGYAPGPLHFGFVIPAATGIILGAVYMLWMCQRLLFGPLTEPPHTPDTRNGLAPDLTRREIGILAPIALVCLILGVYPKSMLNSMQPAIARHVLCVSPDGEDETPDRAYVSAPNPRHERKRVLAGADAFTINPSSANERPEASTTTTTAGAAGIANGSTIPLPIGARAGAWASDLMTS
ncbi:MAG: NADH-quinone oxidoreductase subunit M, partial [Planctomycetes bacterium]|nr:NADH-quinone oxidoreductase subunit M [Planctomycetota bacterium]